MPVENGSVHVWTENTTLRRNIFHFTEKLAGFECWVTIEDIEGLTKWQRIFGEGHRAVFVFIYKIENVDVDFDGRDYFDFDANRYLFFCIKLNDYRKFIKCRSPKWQTVTLPAEKFRECAVSIGEFLLCSH